MRRVLIDKAAHEIRQRLWRLIKVNRRLAVEVSKSADDMLVLVVYLRLPGAPWWEARRLTIEIGDGAAILPDNIPIRAAVAALNAAAGRQVVKARRFWALCPQCGTAHEEWVNSPAGDHCVFCGWVVGTKPAGHVEVGDRFWVPVMGRVVVHPLTKVRVVWAHNQVTGCFPDESRRARPRELPQEPLPLRDVRRAVPGYEYILVEVVELPQEWGLVPYK